MPDAAQDARVPAVAAAEGQHAAVSEVDLRGACEALSADLPVGSPGHPSEEDVRGAAVAMLTGALPDEYEADEDEMGRSFYYSKMTGASSWSHPLEGYYRGWLFMHRGRGAAKTEANARASPSTPDEIRHMAAFFGVDPAYARAVPVPPASRGGARPRARARPTDRRAAALRARGRARSEHELLPVVRSAVHAPLPPGWVEQPRGGRPAPGGFEGPGGGGGSPTVFFHTREKRESEEHPLDAYFREEIARSRRAAEPYKRHAGLVGALDMLSASLASRHTLAIEQRSVPPPWMEFVEAAAPRRGAAGAGGDAEGAAAAAADGGGGNAIVNVNAADGRGGPDEDGVHRYWYNFSTNECSYVHPAAIARQAHRAYYAVRLQALVRGRLERRATRKLLVRRAVAVISRLWLMKREHVMRSRPARLRAVVMATRIQACWRGYACRKRISREKADKLVSKVQAVWRGGVARQRYERMLRSRAAGDRGAPGGEGRGLAASEVPATAPRAEASACAQHLSARLETQMSVCDRLVDSVMQRAGA